MDTMKNTMNMISLSKKQSKKPPPDTRSGA